MICAIMSLDNLEATYYSSNFNPDAPALLQVLLNDFDDCLEEGEAVAISLDGNGDVALMELFNVDDWPVDDGPPAGNPLCYNVMKAYCQTWGLELAEPEYIGPYTLEVARSAYEVYGDFMTIIPVGDVEVTCAC